MYKLLPLSRFAFIWAISTVLLFPALTFSQALPPIELPSQQQVLAAALEGDLQTIEKALAGGFEVNSRDPGGRTLIMYAAFNGHTDLVLRLIEAGADINQKDQGGSTALMFSSSGPYAETVSLLLDKGAEINAVDSNEHFSALMWAAAEGQLDVVKLLLEHKADITLKDVDGDTAESFAQKAGHMEVVKLLKPTDSTAKE